MKSYLLSFGFDIWKYIVGRYIEPSTPPTNATGKSLVENNKKEKKTILCGLTNSVFTKVIHCKSAKELWEKLKKIYEGDEK